MDKQDKRSEAEQKSPGLPLKTDQPVRNPNPAANENLEPGGEAQAGETENEINSEITDGEDA